MFGWMSSRRMIGRDVSMLDSLPLVLASFHWTNWKKSH